MASKEKTEVFKYLKQNVSAAFAKVFLQVNKEAGNQQQQVKKKTKPTNNIIIMIVIII